MTQDAPLSMRQQDILDVLETGPASSLTLSQYIGRQEGRDGSPLASVRRDIGILNTRGYRITHANGLYTWQQSAVRATPSEPTNVTSASL